MLRSKAVYLLLAVFFSLFLPGRAQAKNEITAVRWSVQNDAGTRFVRIVADLQSPANVKATYKNNTLTVDIDDVLPGKNIGRLPIKSEKIKQVTSQKVANANTRIVIRLSGELPEDGYKVFTLKKDPPNKKPDRVVIDIFEQRAAAPAKGGGLSNKIIAIDPGHGGSDPGAIGAGGTREKDCTLAISLKLRDALIKKGAKVVMTRVNDTDVFGKNASAKDELQARVNVGAKAKADIFVSVHNNASVKRDQGGLSTYYYAKNKYDGMLAAAVQKSLTRGFALSDKGVRQADFYVVKRSAMPAILLEIGFISNQSEEKLLKSVWFQNKVVTCVVQGLEEYFAQAGGGK